MPPRASIDRCHLAANLLHLPREGAGVETGKVLEQSSLRRGRCDRPPGPTTKRVPQNPNPKSEIPDPKCSIPDPKSNSKILPSVPPGARINAVESSVTR